jgi:phosphatidylserine/phosphatidylglycerophosphate/cardiolipin synthase-like enzyme
VPIDQKQFLDMVERIWQDGQLTRSESESLDAFLTDSQADDHALGVYRHLLFERWREWVAPDVPAAAVELLEETLKRLRPASVAADGLAADCQAYFSSKDDCLGVIQDLLAQARQSIDICVFTITDDRIADAMVRAKRRGITIRIITDDDKSEDLGSDIHRLASLGIETREDRSDRHMHHKFAIFDQKTLLTGSYNWTRGAAERNLENFIVTTDARLLRAFQREFDRLWDHIID